MKWLEVHYEFTGMRREYAITNGPGYQYIDEPNASLFHIKVANLPRAMEYFGSQAFKESTARATV